MTTAHAVLPSDEGRHTPDADDLWNESYYCDFVQADRSLGGWIRLGLYPNRRVAWWTTWIVWPDRPGVCSVDYHAPVPPGNSLVSESDPLGRVEIDLRHPLEEFRLAARVRASGIERPEEVYGRGEASGRPTGLDLDLTWTTDGVPYHYVATTRYEIPCLVTGTVTVDGETLPVDGHGQRDHSWGVRDWWAFGWCWCSMRLDDGTRIHLADIRIPGLPAFFGYVQTPGTVHPVTALSVVDDVGEHGFPRGPASTSPPPRRTTSASTSHRWPSGPCSFATTTAGRAVSRERWRCAAPTTGARDQAGSSGTSPIRHRDLSAT